MSDTAQNTAQDLSQEGTAIKTLLDVAATNPDLLTPEDIVFIEKMGGKVPDNGGAAEPATGKAPVDPAAGASPAAPVKSITKKTRLSTTTIDTGAQGGDEVWSFEKVQDAVQSAFGIPKGPDQIEKFTESAKKWRKEATTASGISKKYNDLVTSLDSLPVDLAGAFEDWAKGGDYRSRFSTIDYSKDVDAHSPKALLDAFFPGEFTVEDVKEMEDNPAVEKSYRAAKQLYKEKKSLFDSQAARRTQDYSKLSEIREKAASESVEAFKQSFPDADQDTLSEISDIIGGGDDSKLLGLFFDERGLVRRDAARKVAMLMYGEEDIKAKDEVIAELQSALKRGAGSKPIGLSGSSSQGGASPELAGKLSALSSWVQKKTY